MKLEDLFKFKKDAPAYLDDEPVRKRRGRHHMTDLEIARRVQNLWTLMGEAMPARGRGVTSRRPEIDELAVRLSVVWEFYRSDGFNLMKASHERALLYELRAIRTRLIWLKYLRARDVRDEKDWDSAMAWVLSDDSEYEAELLKTFSMSAPQRPKESVRDWVERLRNIRAAIARSPPE